MRDNLGQKPLGEAIAQVHLQPRHQQQVNQQEGDQRLPSAPGGRLHLKAQLQRGIRPHIQAHHPVNPLRTLPLHIIEMRKLSSQPTTEQ